MIFLSNPYSGCSGLSFLFILSNISTDCLKQSVLVTVFKSSLTIEKDLSMSLPKIVALFRESIIVLT